MLKRLDELESQSIHIIREAYKSVENLAMLWSLGKDSNVMIWLAKKAFFGHVPFPVVHVDTEKKFALMYEFQKKYTKEWNLNLIKGKCPPVSEIDSTLPAAARSAARKTFGLKELIKKHKWKGIFAGIRRDEQSIRAKERIFSVRNNDSEWNFKDQYPEFWGYYNTNLPPNSHVRIHPLLNWTEIDIWLYTQRENIPIISLYFANDGKRYRSLGDEDITFPVESNAASIDEVIDELMVTDTSERAGRAMDHEAEDVFERLRESGYM